MSRRAVYFLYCMALLTVLALTLGSSALLRISVCMLCMFALSFLFTLLAAKTSRVMMIPPPLREIERGQAQTFRVLVRCAAPLPIGDMTVQLDFDEMPPMKVGGEHGWPMRRFVLMFQRTMRHRGVYSLAKGKLTVSDVFQFFTFTRRFAVSGAEFTVLPQKHKLAPVRMRMSETGPETRRHMQDDASAPSGVRDWRDGDLLKRVHWKLTLKMADPTLRNLRPMVRTYDEAARPDTVILPDLTRVDAVTERALTVEDAICEACLSFAAMQLEAENPVRLLLGAEGFSEAEGASLADLPAFSRALARVPFSAEESYEQAIQAATRRIERTGALVLVTGRLTPRVAECAIRLRQMSQLVVAVIWITDTARADAEALISRLEMADVIARRDNPFSGQSGFEADFRSVLKSEKE